MNEFIGKACPLCKSEFKEEDQLKVCTICGTPHHKECWKENNGCSVKHDIEVAENFSNSCESCGVVISENQSFCHKCGGKVELVSDYTANNAIEEFNNNIKKKKKKSKKLPIIILVILVACLTIGGIVMSIVSRNNAIKAKEDYIKKTEEFLKVTIKAGTNIEKVVDTIQKYWYENIWYDMHGSSIESAILFALTDKANEIDLASDYDSEVKAIYSILKKLPDNILDKDRDELEEIKDAVKEHYSVYIDFANMILDPSGNYSSYNKKKTSTTEEFISTYCDIEDLLE